MALRNGARSTRRGASARWRSGQRVLNCRVLPRSQRALAWTPPFRCVKCTSSSVCSPTQITTDMETEVFCRNRPASARRSCFSCSTAGSASRSGGAAEGLGPDRPASSMDRSAAPFLAFLCAARRPGFADLGGWRSGSSPFGPHASPQSGSLSMRGKVQQRLCQPDMTSDSRRAQNDETLGVRVQS